MKNTWSGSFDSLEAWVLQFSIASGEMLMIRLVEETLIELSRVTVTFYRWGNSTGGKNARSMRKWLKPELCHLLALWLREGYRVSPSSGLSYLKKKKKDIIREPTALL